MHSPVFLSEIDRFIRLWYTVACSRKGGVVPPKGGGCYGNIRRAVCFLCFGIGNRRFMPNA